MRWLGYFQAAALIALSCETAQSQESVDYCIRCSTPDQIYVCRIHAGEGSAEGQQFWCIMNVAQQHGHESCAASSQSNDCSGKLVEYQAPPPRPGSSALPEHEQVGSSPGQAAPAQGKQEPKTLLDFSRKTVDATKNGLKSFGEGANSAFHNTGEKISSVAKDMGHSLKSATDKTLRCVTSLFTSCGD